MPLFSTMAHRRVLPKSMPKHNLHSTIGNATLPNILSIYLKQDPHRKICLVDFQQQSQLHDAIPQTSIVGIIDHHALQSSTIITERPIFVDIRPVRPIVLLYCILYYVFIHYTYSYHLSSYIVGKCLYHFGTLVCTARTVFTNSRGRNDVVGHIIGYPQSQVSHHHIVG